MYLSRVSTYSYLLTYLSTYLPTYLPTYLSTYLPTYLPTLPTYLSTYLPTYRLHFISLLMFYNRSIDPLLQQQSRRSPLIRLPMRSYQVITAYYLIYASIHPICTSIHPIYASIHPIYASIHPIYASIIRSSHLIKSFIQSINIYLSVSIVRFLGLYC